jgi:hypothetical protein
MTENDPLALQKTLINYRGDPKELPYNAIARTISVAVIFGGAWADKVGLSFSSSSLSSGSGCV